MISKDKQYRTRDGREVRIYATDCGESEPVHGAIKFNNEWISHCWGPNGKRIRNSESPCDLIEVKPRIQREYWVNVYTNTITYWRSKNEADRHAVDFRLACVKITIDCEEGEGL